MVGLLLLALDRVGLELDSAPDRRQADGLAGSCRSHARLIQNLVNAAGIGATPNSFVRLACERPLEGAVLQVSGSFGDRGVLSGSSATACPTASSFLSPRELARGGCPEGSAGRGELRLERGNVQTWLV
jgi:hypothetical protein